MSYSSVFDILKIGVGPSSSHTLGPWLASLNLLNKLSSKHSIFDVKKIIISLYGSLSLTGRGHASDIAVTLGLCGFKPDTFCTDNIDLEIQKIKELKILKLNGEHDIPFDFKNDIKFHSNFLPFHPNGLSFNVIFKNDYAIFETYYSTGGGFIIQENEDQKHNINQSIPFQIYKGEHIKNYLKSNPFFKISDFARENEVFLGKSHSQIKDDLLKIWNVMTDAIFSSVQKSGVLPGGLNVKRRSGILANSILQSEFNDKQSFFDAIKNQNFSFDEILNIVNFLAIAVNEENASLGRIVTSPTNGSAGVIPAVLAYYLFCVKKQYNEEDIVNFLLNAGLIGGIFKFGATISAAFGGCQAEIGVSSAMAASALTELMGGGPVQCLIAAEITMEHHLGMTCDPINGLVQIPCIERNAMGAIKAINASALALKTNENNIKIELDEVVKTMLETAKDMNSKYKETSMGGLSLVSVNNTEC